LPSRRIYFQFSGGGLSSLLLIINNPWLTDRLRAVLFSSSVLILVLHTGKKIASVSELQDGVSWINSPFPLGKGHVQKSW